MGAEFPTHPGMEIKDTKIFSNEHKEEGKYQESIQSITTPDTYIKAGL